MTWVIWKGNALHEEAIDSMIDKGWTSITTEFCWWKYELVSPYSHLMGHYSTNDFSECICKYVYDDVYTDETFNIEFAKQLQILKDKGKSLLRNKVFEQCD